MRSTADPRKQFGETIRILRQKSGISQGDLGERAHLDRSYISDIERGLRNVSLLNIVALATALQVHPKDLLADVERTDT